jgi:hypothetical protein
MQLVNEVKSLSVMQSPPNTSLFYKDQVLGQTLLEQNTVLLS